MSNTNTILVLGATGKTGRRLLPHLIARGATVRAASRKPGDGKGRTLFDWNQPDTYDPALAGVDAIYLVPPDLIEDATPIVAPFLDRAARAGVTRIVLLSSMGVEFPNEGPGSARDRLETLVKASAPEWTILRPGGFNQNFSEGFLLPGILHANMIATATGDGAVAFVDAEDIAAVAAAALAEDGHQQATYVITGPEALTFADATAIISKAAGRPIAHRQISSADLTQILCNAGLPANYAAIVVGNQEAIRDGLGARVTDVVPRVTRRPAKTFADYAAQTAAIWTPALARS